MKNSVHPGVHPHSDRLNWQPADTMDEYLANCREGLETFTDKRAAKLCGMSRVGVYRARLMARLPESLFERLIVVARETKHGLSKKMFANIAIAIANGGNIGTSRESCPHCGEIIRRRSNVPEWAAMAVNDWINEQ